MAIAFNASNKTSSSGTAVQITVPPWSTNDLLVACIQWSQGPTITPPAGWTLLSDYNTLGGIRQATYYRIAGSEPSSYTWTLSTSVEFAGIMADYTGTHPTAPIEINGYGGQTSPGSNTITCPSVITDNTNDWLLCFYGQNDSGASLSPATGQTTRNNVIGQSLTQILLADEALSSAGSTGSRNGSSTSSLSNIGECLAIIAAGATGPPFIIPGFKWRLKRRQQKRPDRRLRRLRPIKPLFGDGGPPPVTPLEWWGRRRRRPRGEIKPARKSWRWWRGRQDPVVTDKPRALLGVITVIESFSATTAVVPGS